MSILVGMAEIKSKNLKVEKVNIVLLCAENAWGEWISKVDMWALWLVLNCGGAVLFG